VRRNPREQKKDVSWKGSKAYLFGDQSNGGETPKKKKHDRPFAPAPGGVRTAGLKDGVALKKKRRWSFISQETALAKKTKKLQRGTRSNSLRESIDGDAIPKTNSQ